MATESLTLQAHSFDGRDGTLNWSGALAAVVAGSRSDFARSRQRSPRGFVNLLSINDEYNEAHTSAFKFYVPDEIALLETRV